MFVKEWMTPQPRVAPSKTTVIEAMHLLREGGFRRLPVVDDGVLVGIVTDKDLKEATPSKATSLSVYELNYLLSKLSIKDVMKTPVFSVSSSDAVETAALVMDNKKISGLTVVDDGQVVGIITITDILRAFIAALGLHKGGTRVTVRVPDAPGVLEKVASAGPPSNITAVVSSGKSDEGLELVLRANGEGAQSFADRLRAKGIDVSDVR